MKRVEFASSVDLAEVAQDELPHPDLPCLLSIFLILSMIQPE